MYKSKSKKPNHFNFDLLVIGSGAGGGVAAHIAANQGKKVGIVEAHKLGGDCPNYSCIPTKSLMTTANALRDIQQASQFGLRAQSASFNLQSIHAWKNKAIATTNGNEGKKAYTSEGITVLKGHAHFLNQWTVSIGSHRYSARKFLIATGSEVVVPAIPGLKETGFVTYKEISNLARLPKSIAIIGGGATAYEYSQILSAFGVRVHVFEQHKHLLPKEEVEVGDIAEAILEKYGVRVHTNAKITHISKGSALKQITFEQHAQQHHVSVDEILLASGKAPNVDIGLENTGIRYTSAGIKVNATMQTSKKHIFAAGDVIGKNMFAHNAIQQSRVAVHNMYHNKVINYQGYAVPRVFYGEPEIAAVGLTEHELIMTGQTYQSAITPIGIIGRALATDYQQGFVKILANHSGVIVGATIVSPHAGELIHELTFAVQHYRRACDIAQTIHAFPTWSEAIRICASKIKCI